MVFPTAKQLVVVSQHHTRVAVSNACSAPVEGWQMGGNHLYDRDLEMAALKRWCRGLPKDGCVRVKLNNVHSHAQVNVAVGVCNASLCNA